MEYAIEDYVHKTMSDLRKDNINAIYEAVLNLNIDDARSMIAGNTLDAIEAIENNDDEFFDCNTSFDVYVKMWAAGRGKMNILRKLMLKDTTKHTLNVVIMLSKHLNYIEDADGNSVATFIYFFYEYEYLYLHNYTSEILTILSSYDRYEFIAEVVICKQIKDTDPSLTCVYTTASKNGHVGTLNWYCEKYNPSNEVYECCANIAAEHDQRKILSYLLKKVGYDLSTSQVYMKAIIGGHVGLTKWLFYKDISKLKPNDLTKHINIAAETGNYDMFMLLKKNGFPEDGLTEHAALKGHNMDIFREIHKDEFEETWYSYFIQTYFAPPLTFITEVINSYSR